MKLLGALFLLCCLSDAQARVIDVSIEKEDRSGPAMNSHGEGTNEGKKGDSPLIFKERTEEIAITPVDDQDANRKNKESPPPSGGGVAYLDPKYLEQKIDFPLYEPPWWERWWNAIGEWFTGVELDSSTTNKVKSLPWV
jgi:hypothetical protein